MLLFGTGIAGLAGIARRKRNWLIFRYIEIQAGLNGPAFFV
jgi:hypothetical protein